jgi:hypothetical protein
VGFGCVGVEARVTGRAGNFDVLVREAAAEER